MHSNMLNLLLGRPTSIKKEFEISELFAIFVILVEILNRPHCCFFPFFFVFIYFFILSFYYNSLSKHMENQAKFDATLVSQNANLNSRDSSINVLTALFSVLHRVIFKIYGYTILRLCSQILRFKPSVLAGEADEI